MKTKIDRKVNKIARELNNRLQEEFGDRFWTHQVRKRAGYYLYEMCDNEHPERNSIFKRGWVCGYTDARLLRSSFYEEANNFIVDFL